MTLARTKRNNYKLENRGDNMANKTPTNLDDLPSWGLSEIEPAKNQRLHPNWFVRHYTLNQHNSVYAAEQILLHSIDHLNHDWRLGKADYEVMLPNGTKATIHRRMIMFRKRGD